MKRILPISAAALLTGLVPAIDDEGAAPDGADIVSTAKAAGSFKTLVAAVSAAGLVDVLSGKGPFTVLAPTDDAFAKLPEGLLASLLEPQNRGSLQQILKYHVIAGRVGAARALSAGSAKSLEGSQLRVTVQAGRLTIAGARVVRNDIASSNGVIHAIDRVLVPPAFVPPISAPTATGLIELAIERGVPLFNDDQPAACAAIYEVAAASLLRDESSDLPSSVRAALAKAIQTARSGGDPRAAAWTLRHALDSAWSSLRHSGSSAARGRAAQPRASARDANRTATTERRIENFSQPAVARKWRITNDTVMGGRSRSAIRVDGEGTAVFAGTVSLENNGGFASVRRAVDERTFAGTTGVKMRVRGDGKRFRISVSPRTRASGDSYQLEFATRAGEWMTIEMPFAEMERSVFGRKPRNQRPIDPATIRSVGISIGDKQAGDFRLEIDWLGAYAKGASRGI